MSVESFTPTALQFTHGAAHKVKSLVDGGLIPINFVGGFSSQHGQGANFLFCDGSVRFVKSSVSSTIWWALGTASGK